MKIDYTVKTEKSFQEAIESVVNETENVGFKVLYIHDIQETLAKKGFTIEPLKIIEICNAKNAYSVIQKDITLSLFLPCKINIYTKSNKTYITALNPAIIQGFTHDKDIRGILKEVGKIVTNIVDRAGGEKNE